MLRFMIKLPFRIIAAPVWLVLAAVNIVLVFLVVFVLLPHIGMGIVAVIEVVKCGLQEFIFG